MGCNCGGNQPKPRPEGSSSITTQQFALRLNTGQTMTFGSKLEADAENVRRGYTGTVTRI